MTGDSMQKASSCTLPVPAMKPATLHAQQTNQSKKLSTVSKLKGTGNRKAVPKKDKAEINKSLDKLK